MEVILLERLGKIGNLGDVVNVKSGYARNFLLPQGKALRANKENLAAFEARRAELEQKNADAREQADKLGQDIDGTTYVIIRAASDSGALYGSVTPRDIGDAMEAAGKDVPRTAIILDRPIKELGLHDVRVILHPEVEVSVKANVARSEEEAELQASGQSIQSLAADAEAEAEADLAAMLDAVGAASEEDAEEFLEAPTQTDDAEETEEAPAEDASEE